MKDERCYKWFFTKKPDLANYTFAESMQECKKRIEKQYKINESQYIISEIQIRTEEGKLLSAWPNNYQERLEL